MRKAVLLAALVLAGFVLHTLWSTGFFRTVHSHFNGETVKTLELKGAEDITVSAIDSFALISATDRIAFPPKGQEQGGLYLLDLRDRSSQPVLLTTGLRIPFAPHGISMLRTDSTYTVAVVNHTATDHSIEIFRLYNNTLTHIRTHRSTDLISPNDVVLLDDKRFLVTNDHGYAKGIGRWLEEYGNLAVSNVLYFDGNRFSEAAGNIAFANGINIDSKRQLVYVSSPRRFEIKVYKHTGNGELTHLEDIPCGTGVDNIELDQQGNLWIGCHPNLLRFAAYAQGREETSPSEILKIEYTDDNTYAVQSIFTDDGKTLSGSSVAAPFGELLLVGSVKDEKVLVLKLPE